MNRWLAILILSFGTAILVAHAAIPHHHHEGAVCYHHDEDRGHTQEASHQHGPLHPIDFNCSLKQLYIAPSVKKVILPDPLHISWDQTTLSGIALFQTRVLSPDLFPLKLLLHPTELDLPDPAILLTGPRAPPSC
ncbi:hypothetical protein ACFLS7_01885 [Bacteroidota bacterium]